MARILAVDDIPEARDRLKVLLEGDGHEVAIAGDGEEALARHGETPADLILLDLIMPKVDGFEVLRELRDQGDHVPVVLLTGEESEADRIQGFLLGADDYVLKPYSPSEVLLRIKAILQRFKVRDLAKPKIRTGPFTLDFRNHRIDREGAAITMTHREFCLLAALVEKGGETCSREDLISAAWPVDARPSLRSVDVHIARLRLKLGPGESESGIGTVSGEGYRWVHPIAHL